MMIIKKIFSGIFDEEIHSDFLKFGKGMYDGKYSIEGKKRKGLYSIKTSSEFANYLVKKGLEKIDGSVNVTGVIVSTNTLDIPISSDLKQFMGIKQYKVNGSVNASTILDLMEKYPRVFFALSFSVDNYVLKIKPKAPKSAKPSTKEEKDIKIDFCSLKTSDENIIKEIFFDVSDFNEILVKHTIKIDQIVYPKDFSKMKPEEVREQSKRKGILIRKIIVDGKEKKSEANFEA